MNNLNRIVLIFMIFAWYSCNENLSLKEKDVLKYDYLKPFIVSKKINFKGNHNIDDENFEFSYKVEDTKNILKEINHNANKAHWIIQDLSTNKISYSKQIKIIKSTLSSVVVNIKILENDDRIYFEVK